MALLTTIFYRTMGGNVKSHPSPGGFCIFGDEQGIK
jgi:hypothetical protein